VPETLGVLGSLERRTTGDEMVKIVGFAGKHFFTRLVLCQPKMQNGGL